MGRAFNPVVFEEMMKSFGKHEIVHGSKSVHFAMGDDVEMVLFYGDESKYGRIIIYQDAQHFIDNYNIVKDILEETTSEYREVRHDYGAKKSLSHVSFTLNMGSEKSCQQTQKVQEGKGSFWKSLLKRGGSSTESQGAE